MRTAILVTLLLAAGAAVAGERHYLDLVNTAPTSLVAFDVALPGSDDWRAIALSDTALRGGGDSTIVAIRGGGCVRDLRSTFRDGRVLIQRGFDTCRYRSYHTGQYLRRTRVDARRPTAAPARDARVAAPADATRAAHDPSAASR